MVLSSSPLVLLAALSAVVGLALAVVVWRQREADGALSYTVLMLILATWSGLYVGQLLSGTVAGKRPWLVVRHALSPAIPIAFWHFAARYTDSNQLLSTRYLVPLGLTALVLAPLPALDPFGLYWRDLTLATTAGVPVLDVTFGPLFWLMIGFIGFVVATGHALFVSLTFTTFAVYRRQLIALAVVGVVEFSLLGSFLSEHVAAVPMVNPLEHVQLLAYSTVFMAIPLGWAYYRDALFSLQPLRHRTVIGNMDDAVVVLDTDGVIRKANEPALGLIGDEGSPVGTSVERALADRPKLLERVRDVAGTADRSDRSAADNRIDPVPLEVDGTPSYVDVRQSDIPSTSGRRIGSVLVVRDVTERARQRERLERKNEQLERLADVVGHDMRTPLATAEKVRTLLERDLAEGTVDDVADDLADLERVHDRLREFAEHIPQLARESTDVESPVDCDLATVAERAWAVVDTGDLSLSVESTTTLRADPRRLEQALRNLFENAATHAAIAGTAELRADGDGGERAPGGARTVRVGATDRGFFVGDDGPGVPPDRREDVFEYGVSSGDGSGFGLAIVRTIVEAHGWEISVGESADGGARFDVRTGN